MAGKKGNKLDKHIKPQSLGPSVSSFFHPQESLISDNMQPPDLTTNSASPSEPHNPLQSIQSQIAGLPSKSDIESLKKLIKDEIKDLKKDLNDMGSRMEFIEEGQDHLNNMVSSNTQQLSIHDSMIQSLSDKIEDLENRGRRNNLRLRGIPEEISQDQLKAYVTDLFHSLLPHASALQNEDIERVHRALRPPTRPPAPPRDVILRFLKFTTKEAIWQAARTRRSIQFRSHSLQVYQDLCPQTIQRRREVRFITKTLQENNIRYRWGFPFSLIISHNGAQMVYKSFTDLDNISKRLNLSFEPPPERILDTPPRNGHPDEEAPRDQRPAWSKVASKRRKTGPPPTASDP